MSIRIVYLAEDLRTAAKPRLPSDVPVSMLSSRKVGVEAILEVQEFLLPEAETSPLWWILLYEGEVLSSKNLEILQKVASTPNTNLDILTAKVCTGAVEPRAFLLDPQNLLCWDEASDNISKPSQDRPMGFTQFPDPIEAPERTKTRLLARSVEVLAKEFRDAACPHTQARLAYGLAVLHKHLEDTEGMYKWLKLCAASPATCCQEKAAALLALSDAEPEHSPTKRDLIFESIKAYPLQANAPYKLAKLYEVESPTESVAWAAMAHGLSPLTIPFGDPKLAFPEADMDGPVRILRDWLGSQECVTHPHFAQLHAQLQKSYAVLRQQRAQATGELLTEDTKPLILFH